MDAAISPTDFQHLSAYIERECGLHLESEKAYLVETRLTPVMALCGCDTYASFFEHLQRSGDPKLKDKVIDAITTNETLWFRDTHPYDILREFVLPQLEAEFRSGKRVRARLWSAAASTGQEAYSIAMTILEYCRIHPGLHPQQFEILATDISPAALTLAQLGRYDGLAISRGLPEAMRDRYFRPEGRIWILDESVKKMVSFRRFNLQESPACLGVFDVIFIRYVLIYFTQALKQQIFSNLAKVLSPSGCMIIGATESVRGLTAEFEARVHGTGTYHVKIA